MFLPQNYEAPKQGNHFMRLQDGENRFRILSAPLLGWEDWTIEPKKPVRYRFNDKPTTSIDPRKPVKHFWAMVVWNYLEEEIQIFQISQASIRKQIEDLVNDKDWGAPYFYDLKIIRSGKEMKTKYTVNPVPAKPVGAHIELAFNERRCSLEALFSNEDPFGEWDFYTDGIFSTDDLPKGEEKPIPADAKAITELKTILSGCSKEYQEQLKKTLSGTPINVASLEEIPASIYPRILAAVKKKREEYQRTLEILSGCAEEYQASLETEVPF